MTTLDLQVSASADDAFENTGGNMLVTVAQVNVDAADKYHGFRFQGVTIPAGATIDAAYLEVYLYHANLDEPAHTIYAEDGANPAAFSASTSDISNRTSTTATVEWNNADIGSTGFVQSPSLASVIQELVDTHDYSSGAPVVLIIQGSADANRDLGVMHYDGEPAQAAKLHIEYTAGGGSAVTVNASPGAASVSGVTATVDAATRVSAGAATVQVNGITASMQVGSVVTVNASPGVASVSGVTATVDAAPSITAAAGVVQLVGNAATVVAGGVTVQAAPGVAPMVGQRATIETARYLYDLAVADETAYQIILSDEAAYSSALSDDSIYTVKLEDTSRGSGLEIREWRLGIERLKEWRIVMAQSGSYMGLHMQDPVEEWDQAYGAAYVQGRQFRLLKTFHPEDYRTLQRVSPGTEFVFRPWIDDFSQGDWVQQAGNGPVAADAAADDYIGRFKDSVNQHMAGGYVESLNEEYPTRNAEKLAKIVAFDRAFVRRLAVHCPHVKPVVFCAAVGNPDHHEYQALVTLARETAQAGGAFGYHGYWTVSVSEDGSGAKSFVGDAGIRRDLHMRWEVIDAYLVERGIKVKWMLGEVGATKGGPDGYNPDVIEGWKSPRCWGGNGAAYMGDIAAFDRHLSSTEAAREGRLIGAVLFTSRPGDGGTWKYFNVTGSMMWRVAEHVAKTAPGAVVEPPEPPEEGENGPLNGSDRQELWAFSVSEQISQGISLNPGAKLQGAILADGLTPVLREGRWQSVDGRLWAWQAAEKVDGTLPRRVYYCEVGPGPSYFDVFWYEKDGSAHPADGEAVWAPVGSPAERQAAALAEDSDVWPGEWVDANAYGNYYKLRDGMAYHTGADLNLNKPRWNSDRGQEVYAVADGDVVYAGRFNDAWGNLVVIRHSARGGFYSRYAHLATVEVKKGDVVFLGEQLGTVGGAEIGLPDHLHFDISTTDVLERNPGDWPGSSLARLRNDYVDPKVFLNGA